MSTPNIPDDELDDFFRKSLGNPELDFREEDWLKMEQKLKDTNAREKAFYRRFLYSLLGLLLIIAPVLTWYFVSRPAQPAVAVRVHENTESTTGNTNMPNNTAYTKTPENKNGIKQAPDSKQVPAGKEDENKPETFSASADKIEPAAGRESVKQKNIPPQDESLTNKQVTEQPIEPTVSTRQKTGATGKNTQIQGKNEKEKNLENFTPATPDLLSGKPDVDEKIVNTQTKKAIKGNSLPKQDLTQSEQNKPVENQPSAITEPTVIVIDPNNNKPVSDTKNEKGNKNSAVSGKTVAKKEIQTQDISNSEGDPIGIISQQNRQDNKPSSQQESAPPDLDYSNSQPMAIYLIETIPGLSTQPLPYDLELTKLITRQALPLINPEQSDSARRQRLAIKKVPYRLSVNLLISPDLSSIGFSKWRTPGTNVGVSLEYHISNKISVSVGAIYSTKIYEAAGKNYNPASSYWANYYPKPVDVKGTCKVIDLPVNIRYNFLNREKYNLYVSGGLSSYLMLKEDYKYIYKVYDPNQRYGWHGKNENKHFFKVVNLSAGYERKLNGRFSFQAEPFIKLPAAGVGYGRIKLLSTGLFMSMKYNF